jgi:putative Ca2+/H+ antiporter (TMEM165/GDT1 family)
MFCLDAPRLQQFLTKLSAIALAMDFVPLLASFGIIMLAELGDKTQLAVITLSSKRKSKSVFIGALLAFAVVDGVSALVGGAIAAVIPTFWIGIGVGIAFIAFAVYTLAFEKAERPEINDRPLALASTFSLVALMELGDKTQLASISLAAEYDAPIMVFIGVMLAFTVLAGLGVVLGTVISRLVPLRYVRIGSGLPFIVFGVLFVWSAVSGVKLF